MIKNRKALITGSTSGIGEGIARVLAKQGTQIMLHGFGDQEKISDLRRDLKTLSGAEVPFSSANLRNAEEVETLIKEAISAMGTIDILVNNAGIQHVDAVQDFPAERWDDVIAINLSAAFHAIRLAIPNMQANGWGRIINIASAHGLVASAKKSAYVAAKHGLLGLTKVVALENAQSQITCNALCPGWVLTPLVQKQIDANSLNMGISVAEAEKKLLAEKQPSQRFTTPEQLGEIVAFLCSDAASNVTGASWSIDGGWTAQ
jgi:3-hydroxybutyrate dehydrogenase